MRPPRNSSFYVAKLAECRNVVAKLGGLVMAINGFGFHKNARPATSEELVAATRDYYLHMIDCFGVDRCMFESNFPVDAALFHDTAVRVYGVP